MDACGLTKKAEPPPTRDVNRDSGTDSANGGWLRRLVRPQHHHNALKNFPNQLDGFQSRYQWCIHVLEPTFDRHRIVF